jgi:hypothetical protein
MKDKENNKKEYLLLKLYISWKKIFFFLETNIILKIMKIKN